MKMRELSRAYLRRWRAYEAKRKRIEEHTASPRELENKRAGLKSPSWIDLIVRPITQELARRYPDREVEVLGPFGLSSAVALHLHKRGIPENKKFDADNCLSVVLVPINLHDTGSIGIRDYSRNTQEYPKGSIGEVNEFNYPTVPIPADEDIAWIIPWIT